MRNPPLTPNSFLRTRQRTANNDRLVSNGITNTIQVGVFVEIWSLSRGWLSTRTFAERRLNSMAMRLNGHPVITLVITITKLFYAERFAPRTTTKATFVAGRSYVVVMSTPDQHVGVSLGNYTARYPDLQISSLYESAIGGGSKRARLCPNTPTTARSALWLLSAPPCLRATPRQT